MDAILQSRATPTDRRAACIPANKPFRVLLPCQCLALLPCAGLARRVGTRPSFGVSRFEILHNKQPDSDLAFLFGVVRRTRKRLAEHRSHFCVGVPRVHFSGGAAELLTMSASVRTYRRHRMALALACASLVHALDAGSFRTGPRPPGRPFRASSAATVNVAKDFSVDEESLRCVREPFSTIRVQGSRTRPRHRACGAALSADSSPHLAPAPF